MQPDKEHQRPYDAIYICAVGMEASTKYMYLPHIMLHGYVVGLGKLADES